jgi:glucose/arabinose dehydrogenase
MNSVVVLLFCLALTGLGFVSPSRSGRPDRATQIEPRGLPLETPVIELEPVLTGLANPVYVTSPRDGTGRLFIVEQPGRILVLHPQGFAPTVFLDITSRIRAGGEQGLLGLAFHPDYSVNHRFFVNYTRALDGATVIAEYHASGLDPDSADQQETVLLVIPQPFANHNGGMIEFGPDGFLYIGVGDGGSANDPGNRAQNKKQLLGKILRIDVDHPEGSRPYSSPEGNPFFGSTPGKDEIYAQGLRNPWRFSFDRLTGRLYAGDVGQNAWEEVDIVTAGGNYGWRVFEGDHCTNNDSQLCGAGGFVDPIAEYGHAGGRCSITGGYVYRGTASTLPFGSYMYADFCTGEIFLLQNGPQTVLMDTSLNISSFGEDEAGEIYVVDLGGSVYRVTNPNPPTPAPPLEIESVLIRRRSNGNVLQPVTVKKKGKKFNIEVTEAAAFPSPASDGAVILANGVLLATEYQTTAGGQPIFVARLKQTMLRQPGQLVVEVVRVDGTHSNQLTLDVVSAVR